MLGSPPTEAMPADPVQRSSVRATSATRYRYRRASCPVACPARSPTREKPASTYSAARTESVSEPYARNSRGGPARRDGARSSHALPVADKIHRSSPDLASQRRSLLFRNDGRSLSPAVPHLGVTCRCAPSPINIRRHAKNVRVPAKLAPIVRTTVTLFTYRYSRPSPRHVPPRRRRNLIWKAREPSRSMTNRWLAPADVARPMRLLTPPEAVVLLLLVVTTLAFLVMAAALI